MVYGDHLEGIKTLLKAHHVALRYVCQEPSDKMTKEGCAAALERLNEMRQSGATSKNFSFQDFELKKEAKKEFENKKLDFFQTFLFKKGKKESKGLKEALDSLPLWIKETSEFGFIRYRHEITVVIMEFGADEYQLNDARGCELGLLLKDHKSKLERYLKNP